MNGSGSFWAPLGAAAVSALALIVWPGPVRGVRPQTAQSGTPSHLSCPGESATLLPDGRLVLLGGQGATGPVAAATAEDPVTGSQTPLPIGMGHARAWQSATVLPGGKVLIFGGVGTDGHVVRVAELFDPATKRFINLPPLGVVPRARHTATLLTDGTVLFAGGIDGNGQTLRSAQIWDPRTNTASDVPGGLLVPRSDQTATLGADGTVLLWGGKDPTGTLLTYGEGYDPATDSLRMQTAPPPAAAGPAEVAATIPEDGSENVPASALISMRFSTPVRMASVNAGALALSGPDGAVSAGVVAAEGGMLAFLTPKNSLTPGTTYTVDLNGAGAADGSALPEFSFAFTTAGKNPSSGGEVRLPSGSPTWPGGPQNSPWAKLPPLEAPPGVTAISGHVLLLSGTPLRNVTLRVGGDSAETDGTGRFLLRNIPSGRDVLVIDGRTANSKAATYGVFPDGVDVTAARTNVLGYTIWMPALDTAHAVTIPVPASAETAITNPLLPGLELHLPASATITDIDGKTVNQVSITPIPVSQPPFPLPAGVKVPIYFTIQPGGGWIWVKNTSGPDGGWLVYPNAEHERPGTRFNFWDYSPGKKGWYVYGQGSVTPNGASVVPDPGVVIYALTGAMVASPTLAPGKGPCDCSHEGGDPVDTGTGLFIYRKVDLDEPDVIPIVLTRTYRQGDSATRDFGIGTQNPYDMFLTGDFTNYSYADLVMVDGSEIYFPRTSPGTTFSNAVFQNTSAPGPFFGAVIQWDGNGWALTRRDGMQYFFPGITNPTTYQQDGLTQIQDRNGSVLTVVRNSTNYTITKVTSPNGRWIQFTYDSTNRVTQAQDELGRTVLYSYDSSGRLTQVTDANNGVWRYAYDASNNMTSITNPRGITYLQNQFDSSDRVSLQTHADGGTYKFAYTTGAGGAITETDITDPNNNLEKVTFSAPPTNPSGFITGGAPASIAYAAGTSIAEAYAYVYQTGTNLLTSATDPLNRTTTYTYDGRGNATSITRLSGTSSAVTTSFTYDPVFNQVTSITDPLALVTSFSYDPKGNLLSASDVLGNVTKFTSDSEGRLLTTTDPANETTTFAYTGADLTAVADPLNRTTSLSYDSAGRLSSVTSPMNHLTQYAYNPLDETTSITDPLSGVTSFTYDGNGNLLTLADPKNTSNPTKYAYDSMDRLQTRTDPLSNSETYGYDKNGNLTSFTDRRGKITTYNYDALNRRTFAGFNTQPGPVYDSTIGYSYDLGDRLTQAVDSAAGTFNRTYDGLDRLTREQGPEGTVGYQYDADGRRTQMTIAGVSNAVDYSYDNDSRLISISQGTTNVAFAYDAASRRTLLTLPNGVVESYSYDAGSQLTEINYQLAGASLGNLSYAYDNDGCRIQLGGTWARTGLPNATTSTAVYNVANELTSWNGAALTYDPNGNMTGDGTNTYTWDSRNHLSGMSGVVSVSFVYDPFDRRQGKTIAAVTTNFLYDAANPVQELSGTAVTANLLTGLGIDEYFQRVDQVSTRNFLTDALGSTLAFADSTGTVQTSYTYDPYGGTTAQGAASANSYEFTGRENDGDGLYFYRARYYSPMYGRFVSQDPAGFTGGINLYAYVGCDPVSETDPGGTAFKSCAEALADLAKAFKNLAGDAANALKSGCPDPGHRKELAQKARQLAKALDQVKKYCMGPRWLGPGGVAATAIAAAEELLRQAGEYTPEVLEALGELAAAGAF